MCNDLVRAPRAPSRLPPPRAAGRRGGRFWPGPASLPRPLAPPAAAAGARRLFEGGSAQTRGRKSKRLPRRRLTLRRPRPTRPSGGEGCQAPERPRSRNAARGAQAGGASRGDEAVGVSPTPLLAPRPECAPRRPREQHVPCLLTLRGSAEGSGRCLGKENKRNYRKREAHWFVCASLTACVYL